MKAVVTDKILLYKVRTKKDKDAFAKLYNNYVEPIYRFVYFKLSNQTEAEDVTSEVFLKAWDYLTKTPDRSINNFRGLVYKIARNSIIDVYRERTKRQECSIEVVAETEFALGSQDTLWESHDLELLVKNIKRLKTDYQEVIQLKYIEGLSIREISSVLGKKGGNVRVTIHRAVKKLKQLSNQ